MPTSERPKSLAQIALYEDDVIGEAPIYDKDPAHPSYVISTEGDPTCITGGVRVCVPRIPPTGEYEEEKLLFALLDAASSDPIKGPISANVLLNMKFDDLPVRSILIAPSDVSKLEASLGLEVERYETQESRIVSGALLGMDLYFHPECPEGTLYILPDPAFYGRLCRFSDNYFGMLIYKPQHIVRISLET